MTDQRNNQHEYVLVVDDDEVLLSTIQLQLEQTGYQIKTATNAESALFYISVALPVLILLDIQLPGMNGIQLGKALHRRYGRQTPPIIYLTANSDYIIAGFESGGVDYVTKPFHTEELLARVNTHSKLYKYKHALTQSNRELEKLVNDKTQHLQETVFQLQKEIAERKALQERLYTLSKFDLVTRLPSRQVLDAKLSQIIMNPSDQPGLLPYLAYVDLDNFRVINDMCSRSIGDEFLRDLAQRLTSNLPTSMLISRTNSDEFAFCFTSTNATEALAIGQKIKTLVERFQFSYQEHTYQVNASLGLVEISAEFNNVDYLINTAERTCLESKALGGSEITLYKSSKVDLDFKKHSLQWIPIIQEALEYDHFFLCCQSIVGVTENTQPKKELLIRLRAKDGSVKPPGMFIPIAERFHLIHAIDCWVINKAIELIQRDTTGTQYSVNVSGESINKPKFLEFVTQALTHANIDGRRLCLEITETSAMNNLEATLAFIEGVKQYHCEVALDDFGTGTSSYGYLKQLPVDYLKIDGLFVVGIEHDAVSKMMVESITAIAKVMDIKVVAECIENSCSYQVVKQLGVDYVQGYYFDKPEPIS